MEDLGDTLRMPDGKTLGPQCGAGGGADLVFLEGPHAGQVIPLAGPRIVVGRREDADLVLASRSVSKEHCVFIHGEGVVEIEDLGSTNGVAVNGTRLQPGARRRLFHGDSIRLGENLALLRQSGCFGDANGDTRIHIDHARVASEVDQLMAEFGPRASRP